MKAILQAETGGPEVLTLGEAAEPVLGERDVLVRVQAAGVNRADILQRKGLYPPPPGASPVMGLEVAGRVVRVSPGCRRRRPGERVFAVVPGGGYAEYAAVDERLALPVPENLTIEEAAGIGEVFLTAYQALFFLARIAPQESVLFHAGASGVGTAGIQLARSHGCRVLVTAGSARKLLFCRELGADTAINYREEEFPERVMAATAGQGVDVIVDVVGAPYFKKDFDCIATDGRLIILSLMGGRMLEKFDLSRLLLKRIQVVGSTLRNRSLEYRIRLAEAFAGDFLNLFVSGDLRPVIDRVFPWDRAADAHRCIESNETIGKVVLTLGGSTEGVP
jgi:tumor protein p53-inducible protein 3